ncbi:MAG: hypothetical protein LBT30_02155 [Clostridiales bacterium]|jgi:hypothetical protein|nr:hypothetical protein [Clostridiales bacterium]
MNVSIRKLTIDDAPKWLELQGANMADKENKIRIRNSTHYFLVFFKGKRRRRRGCFGRGRECMAYVKIHVFPLRYGKEQRFRAPIFV